MVDYEVWAAEILDAEDDIVEDHAVTYLSEEELADCILLSYQERVEEQQALAQYLQDAAEAFLVDLRSRREPGLPAGT